MTDKLEKLFENIQATLDSIKADNEESNRRSEVLRKNIWNVEELAIFLRRSADRVSRMAKQRLFPSYKQNGQYYFKREEIEQWLTANRIAAVDELNSKAALHVLTHR